MLGYFTLHLWYFILSSNFIIAQLFTYDINWLTIEYLIFYGDFLLSPPNALSLSCFLCHNLSTLGTTILNIPGFNIRRITVRTAIQKIRSRILITYQPAGMKLNWNFNQWFTPKTMPRIHCSNWCLIRSIPNFYGISTGMTFILRRSTQVYPQNLNLTCLNLVWGPVISKEKPQQH